MSAALVQGKAGPDHRPGVAARVLLAGVRAYRALLSPALGAHCRFLPSCSSYALMALEEWGALRGSWLTLRRLARCHPFHPGGLDLPPRRAPAGDASSAAEHTE